MTHLEAVELLRPVGIEEGGAWADLGAGEGRFSWALADLLGKEGRVTAVDKQARALSLLEERAALMSHVAQVKSRVADLKEPLGLENLDGILLANSLHYVKNQRKLLAELTLSLKPNGKLVIIEYDRRRANLWIPHPVSFERLRELAAYLKLPPPKRHSARTSRFGNGQIYVASVRKEIQD